MGLLRLLGKKSFCRGVNPPENKQTGSMPIRRIAFAPRLAVPLSQHIGGPAKPLVRPGQEVVRGEPIAEADGFMSVPVHAPLTGTVEAIERIPTAGGPKSPAIVIRGYPGDSQRVLYGTPQDPQTMSREELLKAIQSTGMVGLGGAGFPTHVKLSIPEGYRVDTLLVNGCECEPYLTTDHRVMLECPEALIRGIRIVLKALGAESAIIAVEDNKPDAITTLRSHLPEGGAIRVEVVSARYPQGSEKMLVKTLLKREIPSGGFPYQIGTVIQNVGTLAQLGELLPQGRGLIERVITVAGPAVAKPGNYLVPIGTPLRFLLDALGFHGSAKQIILGGPMMGSTVASLEVPITKPVSGILALDEENLVANPPRMHPCIHCGRCLSACPMHLNPSQLGMLAAKRRYKEMTDHYHLNDCLECGCCSYVCPSHIPLVQYFRIAKSVQRERAA